MSKQKTVIKLGLPNAKNRSKAMQIASKFGGVNAVVIAGDDRLEVSGENINIAGLINQLRKKVCNADIVMVENKEEEEKKKKKEEEDKKKKAEEEKKKAEEAKKKAEEAKKKADEELKKFYEAYPPPLPYPAGYYNNYYNSYRPPPPPTPFLYEQQAQPEGCHIM